MPSTTKKEKIEGNLIAPMIGSNRDLEGIMKHTKSGSRGKIISGEVRQRVFTPLANSSKPMQAKFDYTRKSNAESRKNTASRKFSRGSRKSQVLSVKEHSNSIMSNEVIESLNLPNRDLSNREIGPEDIQGGVSPEGKGESELKLTKE